MKSCLLGLAISAGVAFACSAKADLIAYWNFNNSTAGTSGGLGTMDDAYPFAANAGSGTITTNFSVNTVAGTSAQNTGDLGTFGGTTDNALFGDASGGALAMRAGNGVDSGVTNNGKWVQFNISTVGITSALSLSYATRNTSTGFQSQTWEYSVDGLSYTLITVVNSLTTSFAVQTININDLAAYGAANLRLRVTFDGATNQSGNNRIDNVQINGVPTPGTLGLLAASGLIAIRRRRA
ncbi:MAG: hypothetical protein KF691_08055 [Phycisphaeraceae bacterium]|nr:hypothetical protein [Phycisphaeraceae bacterium]